jgi:hypothetical protein
MKLLKLVGFGSLIAAFSFLVGAEWGLRRGTFQAGLEENKVSASNPRSSEPNLCPESTAYLKGRIYYNPASKFPNDEGYLLRGGWDFGSINKGALNGRIYAKDPGCGAESFDSATRHLSAVRPSR